MSVPSHNMEVKYVSSLILRRLFNKSQLPEMISDGSLKAQHLRNTHLKTPELKGEPQCTHGQMIRYLDTNGEWQAEVFQYLRPDGTLGASGKQDPKRVKIGNGIFVLKISPTNSLDDSDKSV